MANRRRNSGNHGRLYFGGAPKSLQMVIAAMKLKYAYLTSFEMPGWMKNKLESILPEEISII